MDAFLLKFTNRGALEWAVAFGGAGNDIAYDLQQDSAQNVYFCGQFSGTANLVPVSGSTLAVTSEGGADGFIGQIEFTGRLHWLRRMGGAGEDVVRQITTDKPSNTCVT